MLGEPWAFKRLLMDMQCRSTLLVDSQNKGRTEREMLLHLVFPDAFETIILRKRQEAYRGGKDICTPRYGSDGGF